MHSSYKNRGPFLALFLLAIGGCYVAASAAGTTITVSPTSTSVNTGGTIQFKATVQTTSANTAVTWKASIGTISATGLYTAPSTAGTATITVFSHADTSKIATATATITVPGVSSVSVFPTAASVATSGTKQFTASVSGTVTNKSVTWKAARGTITSSGVYTAPGSTGTDTVTATSV